MTSNAARAIELSFRCEGRHGAYPGERDVMREFTLDVWIRGAVGEPEVRALEAITCDAFASRSRTLLERAAADVAEAILEARRELSEIRVRVTKPDPPGLDAESEAASVTLRRQPRAARSPSARRGRPHARRARG